jgi:hypothetical protein
VKEIRMLEYFPTMEEVEKANREQLGRWLINFLPAREIAGPQDIMDRIADRFMNMGGMTPGLRKKLAVTGFHLRNCA